MILRQKWGKVIVGLVVVYILISGNRGLWNLYKLHQEKHAVSDQIVKLKTEINQTQTEYKAYEKNNTTMEKQAREELNLVKPGEIVYKFSNKENR